MKLSTDRIPNKILAIETSSEACSLALQWDGMVCQCHQQAPLQHAEFLLPWVRELLTEAQGKLAELDAIAFGRGPGSFTSLRIGIGAVQGLAYGAAVPVIPLSSLAAVAEQVKSEPGQSILVAMDARMGEVFHGLFKRNAAGELVADGAEAVSAPEQIRVSDPARTLMAGSAFGRFPQLDTLAQRALSVQAELMPSAAALVSLANQWLHHHAPLPAAMAQAVYLRDDVADKPGNSSDKP